jgi:hypothetical protein
MKEPEMTITTTCPRQRSDMTPCYLKDGDLAEGLRGDTPICVGCDCSVKAIIEVLPMTVSADAADVSAIIQETLAGK